MNNHITPERLEEMINNIEKGALLPKETDLIAFVVLQRSQAFAWIQEERGSFS